MGRIDPKVLCGECDAPILKRPGDYFDCVNGEILRVAAGFTRGRKYDLLINMRGRVRYKRWHYYWGDEIIAHYEEVQ